MKPKSKSFSSRRLLSLVKPWLGTFIVAMIALAAGSGINLLFPEIIRRLLDSDSLPWLLQNPFKVSLGLIGLFALQSTCFYFRTWIFGLIGQRVVANLRQNLYGALIRRGVDFFDRERTGDLVSRLSADTQLIQDAVSVKLSIFIRYGIQVIAGVALMAWISLWLTFSIVLSLPILVAFSIFLGKKLKFYSKMQQQALAESTVIAEETFSASRIVKAFNREKFEQTRFNAVNDRVLALGLQRTAVSAFFQSFVSFLMNAVIVLVFMYGVFLVSRASLSAGELTAFLLYGVIVAVSFAFVASGYGEFTQALGSAEKVFELIDSQDQIENTDLSAGWSAKSGHIEFANVSFAYPSRPEVSVLQEISFSIKAGQKTALVGPSGSGKSTIVNLILRFYDPNSGCISFDGHPLPSLSLSDLRNQIAIVPQDAQLFAVSIAENLRYGKENATQTELEEACKRANILEFVQSLPQGFNTNPGDRGVQLSGGQKQRLAIARAMLRNPALLILDEATSSLDSENEYLVQQALDELVRGRTSLVIAHRLSTIRSAGHVLVLEKGKLVQSGNHETLSSESGLYRRLVERQELA